MPRKSAFVAAEIEGADELKKMLGNVLPKVAKKALRKGVAKGSQLVAKRAKQNVRIGTGMVPGLLKKSLGQRVKVYRNGVVVGIVGARKGFLKVTSDGKRVDPRKYAHFEEKGRKEVVAQKARVLSQGRNRQVFGKRVKAYVGHPFLKPAIEQGANEAQAAMGAAIAETLGKEAKGK